MTYKMGASRYPKNDRQRQDRDVQADPDVRGVQKGRRGKDDDPRSPNGNTPERVERAWKREGRG